MRFTLLALALSGLAPHALAQSIVLDGDDLQAAIDASSPGDVIEIQSDSTFVGQFLVAGKQLTLRAGDGFTPSLTSGLPGQGAAIAVQHSSTETTAVTLEGLTIDGVDAFTSPVDGGVSGELRIVDCDVDLQVVYGAPRGTEFELIVDSTRVGGFRPVNEPAAQAAPTTTCRILNGSEVTGANSCFEFNGTIQLLDSEFNATNLSDLVPDCSGESGEMLEITASGGLGTDLEARRCIFRNSVRVEFEDSAALSSAIVESCAFSPPYLPAPSQVLFTPLEAFFISARSDSPIGIVNSTFRTAPLFIQGTTTAENLLLFDPPVIPPLGLVAAGSDWTKISNSYVADGGFDGINGNFSGELALSCGLDLRPGSVCVDAGAAGAAGLGAIDLFGNPRIQDGDGDGTATVNVGAVETTSPLIPAGVTPVLVPGNPGTVQAVTAPLVGSDLEVRVLAFPTTVATAVIIDLPAAEPFPSPFGGGLLAVSLSPAVFSDVLVPGGDHSIPVPDSPALAGQELRVQGFRISGVLNIVALDAIDLLFGNCG